ncbi:MAG: hypothetical protein AAFZ87_03150 [Planctomycetota bacterium]
MDLFALPLALTLLAPSTPAEHIAAAEACARVAPRTEWYALGALMDAPELSLGDPVRVRVQFRSEAEAWDPLLTRFDPAQYRAFEVWADEQWLWIEEEYTAPAARLFVRRGSSAEAVLWNARPHDRFALRLVVREFQGGSPWIEVTEAAWTAEQTPEGTVLHAIRALDLIERGAWALAVSELERALEPRLPGHVRRELEQILESVGEVVDEQR